MEAIIIAAVLAFNTQYDYNLDPTLFVSIATVESQLNPNAVSRKGALGIMQVMPENWVKYGRGNWRDPYQNVMAACRLWVSQKYRYEIVLALVEYNAGQKWVDTRLVGPNPDLGQPVDYAYKVLRVWNDIRR